MKNIKILLVDDEPDALEFLSYNLKKGGYKVFTASDGKSSIDIARRELPNLIVLDVMMPGMDGIEVCKELRVLPETKKTLIVFFTARNEDYSQIAGLDAGADDYIPKPVAPRVLMSRISAVLRRKVHHVHNPNTEIKDVGGGVKINHEGHSIFVGKQEFVLPKKEFQLIELLTSKPGKVFSREHLLSKLWGEDVIVGDRTIDVHIRRLRSKLGDEKIKTLKGLGYRFEV